MTDVLLLYITPSNMTLFYSLTAKDCDPANGPPCYGVGNEDTSSPIFDTAEACCGRLDWISTSSCVSASTDSSPGSPAVPSNQFFADDLSSSCLQDCEPGPFGCQIALPLTPLYGSIDACCSSRGWIEYEYCTSRSVGKYSNGWVVDYQNAKCGESSNFGMIQ